MRNLKTSLIAVLIVPVFAFGAMAFDHHEGDDKAKKKAAHMAMVKEKCAKAEDPKACMEAAKAAKAAKMEAKKAAKMPAAAQE